MRFMKYTSLLCLVSICALDNAFADNPPAPRPVYMTSQIQRLLNEKQEKISKLEECDGKRKGFMIAGISTIGLTAVGVGVNIAQANKSNKLSNQIADQNRELEKQQSNLANINSQISEIQSNNARRECESQEGKMWVNGQCIDKPANDNNNNGGGQGGNHDYSGYTLDCSHNTFDFWPGDNYTDVFNKLNNQCTTDTGKPMEMISQEGGAQRYECKDYPSSSKCDATSSVEYDGIIGKPCNDAGVLWAAGGDKKCLQQEGATEAVACSCPTVDNPNQLDPNQTDPNQTDPNQTDPNQTDPNQTVPNKPEPSRLEKCLAEPERQGNDEALACCYLDKQVAEFKGGKCVCVDKTKEFVLGANKRGTCKTPEVKPEEIERIVGMDCLAKDIPNGATKAKYVKGGEFKCFESVSSKNIVDCSCKAEECDEIRGYSPQDGKCAEDPVVTGCKASGGDWKWLSGQKKYECHCGTLGNGGTNNERGMKFTSANRCECLSGYTYVDPSNPRKGCRPGSDDKKVDEVVKIFTVQYKNRVNDIGSAKKIWCTDNLNVAATLTDVAKLENMYKQGQTGQKAAETKAKEIENLYKDFNTKYNALNDVEKAKAKSDKDKFDAEMRIKRYDSDVKEIKNCVKTIGSRYDSLKTNASGDSAAQTSCTKTHGEWKNGSCKCDSNKGLEDDMATGGCKCGENFRGDQLHWDANKKKCVLF